MRLIKKKPAAEDQPVNEPGVVFIPALKQETIVVIIFGKTPLLCHAWNDKEKGVMLGKHMQQLSVREAKDPYQSFLRTIYRMDDDAYGFPVTGIKEAMATAAVDLEGVAKAQIYRNIMVTGRRGFQHAAFADLKSPQELGELFSPNPPRIREDMVRLSGMARTPDIRYRAEFWPWAIRFRVSFLPDFIARQSILNLTHGAGARIGLGEWRQEKGGNSGAFHVATVEEMVQVERWIKAGQKEPPVIDVQAWLQSLAPKNAEKTHDDTPAPKRPRAPNKKKDNGNGKTERYA